MEDLLSQIKGQRTISMFTWNIIIIASFGLMLGLIGIALFLRKHMNFQSLPTDSLSNFFNPRLYLFPSIYQIFMSILLILSSIYVLKYYERWRKILVYGLIAEVLFLIITPIINISNVPNVDTNLGIWDNAKTRIVIWSIIISYCLAFFFALVVRKFSRGSIKKLFK